jgi:hypothetical protein
VRPGAQHAAGLLVPYPRSSRRGRYRSKRPRSASPTEAKRNGASDSPLTPEQVVERYLVDHAKVRMIELALNNMARALNNA